MFQSAVFVQLLNSIFLYKDVLVISNVCRSVTPSPSPSPRHSNASPKQPLALPPPKHIQVEYKGADTLHPGNTLGNYYITYTGALTQNKSRIKQTHKSKKTICLQHRIEDICTADKRAATAVKVTIENHRWTTRGSWMTTRRATSPRRMWHHIYHTT